MKLADLLRRERTNVTSVSTTTFNAPGIYYPPYGKTVIQLSGRGSPGNATVPGTVSGSNTVTNTVYVPASGGNYSGSNSYSQQVYVPASGGNASTNPSSGGNPYEIYWGGSIYYSFQYYRPSQGNSFGGSNTQYFAGYSYGGGIPSPSYSSSSAPEPSDPGLIWTQTYSYNYYPIATYAYNPTVPGNTYYNPYSPAYTYYTYVPGNPNYNPYYPAYTYNTGVPGNPNYNPTTPGNTAPSYNVVGISLPGGAADSTAPVIGFSTVSIDYTTAGTPISVPPGGYVSIKNI